uniref:Uncharacterized protein n=1 Tax=Arion vulgaris TaxID=1028688 RepID=A0A0B6ZX95_9EUPU
MIKRFIALSGMHQTQVTCISNKCDAYPKLSQRQLLSVWVSVTYSFYKEGQCLGQC